MSLINQAKMMCAMMSFATYNMLCTLIIPNTYMGLDKRVWKNELGKDCLRLQISPKTVKLVLKDIFKLQSLF